MTNRSISIVVLEKHDVLTRKEARRAFSMAQNTTSKPAPVPVRPSKPVAVNPADPEVAPTQPVLQRRVTALASLTQGSELVYCEFLEAIIYVALFKWNHGNVVDKVKAAVDALVELHHKIIRDAKQKQKHEGRLYKATATGSGVARWPSARTSLSQQSSRSSLGRTTVRRRSAWVLGLRR